MATARATHLDPGLVRLHFQDTGLDGLVDHGQRPEGQQHAPHHDLASGRYGGKVLFKKRLDFLFIYLAASRSASVQLLSSMAEKKEERKLKVA